MFVRFFIETFLMISHVARLRIVRLRSRSDDVMMRTSLKVCNLFYPIIYLVCVIQFVVRSWCAYFPFVFCFYVLGACEMNGSTKPVLIILLMRCYVVYRWLNSFCRWCFFFRIVEGMSHVARRISNEWHAFTSPSY